MTEQPVRNYDPIALSNESTVVAEWVSEGTSSSEYQSEAELERSFITQLEGQAYEDLQIHSEAELVAHLRAQLELLNTISFSDREWERFFGGVIAGKNDGIVQKIERIQEGESVQLLIRDDGSSKNIKLIEGTLGPDHLRLVVAGRYVERLLMNERINRYLEKNHGDILGEFGRIVTALSRPEPSSEGPNEAEE